jgi:hypothetical protein
MANTVLTNSGLNDVLSAGSDLGALLAVKYCVPLYTYNLDGSLHNGTNTSVSTYQSLIPAISASSYPISAEILWNTSASYYTLDTSYIVSGGVSATSGSYTMITGEPQSAIGLGVNLYNGVPLSNSYKGTAIYPPSLQQPYFLISNISGVGGVNDLTTSDRSRYFKVSDYYAITEGGKVRGMFKAKIDGQVGRLKFNRLALYTIRCDENGTEDLTKDPSYFADVYIKESAVKSNLLSEGADSYIVDCELDFSAVGDYYTSSFFASSGDYWSRTVGGLYTGERIGIGNLSGGTDIPQASLHLRPVEAGLSVLRMDSSTDPTLNHVTWSVDSNGIAQLSANNLGGGGISADKVYGVSGRFDDLKIVSISASSISADTIYDGNITEGSFDIILKGFTPYQTITCYYKKEITSAIGITSAYPSLVTLSLPILEGTSSAGTITAVGTPIPFIIRPKNDNNMGVRFSINGYDNDVGVFICCVIEAAGAFSTIIGPPYSTFTPSGRKGWYASTVQYPIWG